MDLKQLIPRFLLSKDVKRCGNCVHNHENCYIKEIENPCSFYQPYIPPAKRAKLYRVLNRDIRKYNRDLEKLRRKAKNVLGQYKADH